MAELSVTKEEGVRVLVFDGDLPMAWSDIDMNRDLTRDVASVRKDEAGMPERGRGHNVVALPEMRAGRVAVAVVKVVGRIARPNTPLWGYSSADLAYAACWAHLECYRALERMGHARIIGNAKSLSEHIEAWERGETERIGLLPAMEGADPILWPGQVLEWWHAGVRVVSLTHYGPSTYGNGTGSIGPLTEMGRALLREMEACGMILDTSHTSDETFWEALDVYTGPVLASHQNCRTLVPRQRQFTDDQIKALVKKGGMIGVSLDNWMLYTDYEIGETPRSLISLDHVVDHIDHICSLAGDDDHVGIGGDLDGGQGYEGHPRELDTIADLQKLAEHLSNRGYSDESVAKVMYKNWVRFYRRHLPSE